jgi:hypothetical protein
MNEVMYELERVAEGNTPSPQGWLASSRDSKAAKFYASHSLKK